MNLLDFVRTHARANRLANRRLHAAMAPLSDIEFQATRVSFFPSLAATLNHILAVDIFYIAALHREDNMEAQYEAFVPCQTLATLVGRQAACDERLLQFCNSLDEAALQGDVLLDRGTVQEHSPAAWVLAHLFMHQTHHRGQAHAMLSGTVAAPPQLDEFLLPSDARLRGDDLEALGWRETDLFG